MTLSELLPEINKLSATDKIKLIRILAEQLDTKISDSEFKENGQIMNKELSNLYNEPFVGMWSDRSDMSDSIQWVREMRNQEWRLKCE